MFAWRDTGENAARCGKQKTLLGVSMQSAHVRLRNPGSSPGKEGRHHGLHRSGPRQRLLFLGLDLHGDPNWNGPDAGAAASRDANTNHILSPGRRFHLEVAAWSFILDSDR